MWISVAVMIACLLFKMLFKKDNKIAFILCGAAWLLFGFYWVTLIPHFYVKADYVNIILVVLLFSFCLILSFYAVKSFKNEMQSKIDEKDEVDEKDEIDEKDEVDETDKEDKKAGALFDLTKLVAVVCLIYLPFQWIDFLNHALIEHIASQTVYLLNVFGFGAVQTAYDKISYNGVLLSVILACTAIESIAFFTGLVLTARRFGPKHQALAFLIVVPAIYVLNLIRNAFVVASSGDLWFGVNSFEIAHHYIGKAGSGVVLIVLAYVTLKLLPELMDTGSDLKDLVIDEVKGIFKIGKKEMK